jgi:hypothetical protein
MEKLEQSAVKNGKCLVWIGIDIVSFEDKEKAVEHVMKLCPEGHEVIWSIDRSTWTPVLEFKFKKIQTEQVAKKIIKNNSASDCTERDS